MERLSDRAIEIINELHTERLDYESEYLPLMECANKCSAYEDTGLEPEDIKQAFTEETAMKLAGQALGVSSNRLRELAQADREGRCVVLPESYYTAEAAARKASAPAEQSERGQAAAWIMQRFGQMS